MALYLDNAATTPIAPEVLEVMLPYFSERPYNPSSSYYGAKKVRDAIEKAREQVAALIDSTPEEIIFTSGGTESNNLIIRSADQLLEKEKAFLSSRIEHSAVLRPLESIAQLGLGLRLGRTVHYAEVNTQASLDLEDYESKLDKASFSSIMWVNNEVGTIQEVSHLAELAAEKGTFFHTDAVQAAGKIPLSVRDSKINALSLSAHKFQGPKGVGALYLKKGSRLIPQLSGGGQENGLRSGTENVPAIIGMGKAAELAIAKLEHNTALSELRNHFESLVLETIEGSEVNGNLNNRVSSLSHLSFKNCEAAGLLILLDEAGVQCSAGSACMTGKQEPSHVQTAMGFTAERANSSLRISFSVTNTKEDAETAAKAVRKAVEKLRSVQTPGVGPVVIYNP